MALPSIKEKYIRMSKTTLLLFLVPLLATCQPKEKFDWNAGISAPRFYAGWSRVVFLYKASSRNYKFNFRQEIIDTACRLHNFRMDQRIKPKPFTFSL